MNMKVASGDYFNYYGNLDVFNAITGNKINIDLFIIFIESFSVTVETNTILEEKIRRRV